MKVSMFFKVALCAFMCSIVCLLAFLLTSFDLFGVLVNWFWLVTYGSLVGWLCSKIIHKVRCGINMCVSIASFAIALYLGVMQTLAGGLGGATLGGTGGFSIGEIAFVAFSVVCAFSTMILICRAIFGNSQKNEADVVDIPADQTNDK